MKAIVYREYGSPDVLELKEVEKPVPRDNEVLIRVYATTVTTGDVNARGFVFVPQGFRLLARLMFGLRKPKKEILGFELAGEIEAIGKNVSMFKEGDQVYGIDGNNMGAYAEYKCFDEDNALVIKPASLTFEEAASIPNGALTALYFLREKGNIESGQKVLVNGASGSVGSAAIQLAKYFGAKVTGVCSSSNIDRVKSLGADHLIDYTKEDFCKNGHIYDIILDTVGNVPYSKCKSSLSKKGKLLLVAAGLPEFLQSAWLSFTSSKKIIVGGGMESERKEYLMFLNKLIEEGKFHSVIDKKYPFEGTADAHRYVDGGHKKGNVVITVTETGK